MWMCGYEGRKSDSVASRARAAAKAKAALDVLERSRVQAALALS